MVDGLKATVVGDIRHALDTPGAVEFHAGKRQIFFTCPCGCGAIGFVDFLRSYAVRDPVAIYKMDKGLDGKPCMGEPMPLGLLFADGTVHWSGTLLSGVWKQDARSEPTGDVGGGDGAPLP